MDRCCVALIFSKKKYKYKLDYKLNFLYSLISNFFNLFVD